jgi:hypothetical protein
LSEPFAGRRFEDVERPPAALLHSPPNSRPLQVLSIMNFGAVRSY